MHGDGFFFQAFVYLAAAVVSVPLAKRLGLGSVLGYLLAGVAIGPFGLGWIGEEGQDVLHFAEFGVVMMLFVVGLELEPELLWRLRVPILGLGGLQVVTTAAVFAVAAGALGLPWPSAIAVGLILSLSSTAIVLQTLQEKGLMKTDGGQNSFAVLLFQDIAVIPMLAILPLLAVGGVAAPAGGHDGSWVSSLPAAVRAGVVLGAVVVVILAGRFLVRPVLRWIASTRLREIFTAAALLLVVGIALLMTQVGLSPALGAFLAGVVLANSEYRHELESDLEPFKGLLLGLFFIAVGAGVDFHLIAARPGLIAGLIAGLVVVKGVVLFGLGRAFRMGLDQNLLFSFALAQGGEFAFVLFSFAAHNGVLPAATTQLLIAVVALSMALTPLLMILNERLIQPRFGSCRVSREADGIDEAHRVNPVIIAGFGSFGNVVGRFLSANRVRTTVLDNNSDRVDVLRKLGLKVFYGDATRYDLLHAAGAAEAKMIVLTLDDPEKILEMVETVRKHFPRLTILARATSRNHAYQLIEAGVEHVFRDTLDSSLAVGVEALRQLGGHGYLTLRSARKFRRHDEDALRELAGTHRDQQRHLNLARQRIQDLEQAIRADLDAAYEFRDEGWDTETLREDFGVRG